MQMRLQPQEDKDGNLDAIISACTHETLWRGLRTRILVAAMVCAALSLFIMNTLMVRSIIYGVTERISGFNITLMRGAEGDRCRAHPSEWSIRPDPESYLFAYDRFTFRSENPSAPVIDPEIVASIQSGNTHALNFHTVDGEWGQSATIIDKAGPCSLLLSGWQPRSDLHTRALLGFLFLLVISLVLTAGIAMVLVVRPLLSRIARLRESASTVGTTQYHTVSLGEQPRDELQALHLLLDKTHARIRSDADLLEARNRSLAEHLSNVAHDMRTPIASLQLALERLGQVSPRTLFQEKWKHDDDKSVSNAACYIEGDEEKEVRQKELDEANALITTSLLDAVYIGALTDNLRIAAQLKDGIDPAAAGVRVDLSLIVEAVVSRARLLANRKGILLEAARPDGPLWVRCQPVMAEQMLQNFVQNAVAYGEENGHVAILLENSLFDAQGNAIEFCLQVFDDGPGVPPEDLPRLGERTFRSDVARTRDSKGCGLGLAIAGEIATRCDFKLNFSAIDEGGLCVRLIGKVLLS